MIDIAQRNINKENDMMATFLDEYEVVQKEVFNTRNE
jgi:hypothetical protein